MNVFKNAERKVQKSSLTEFSVKTWNGNGYNELIKSNATSSGAEVDVTAFTEMHTKHKKSVLEGNLLLSGCGNENDKYAGVGLLLSEKAKKALVFVNAISPCTLTARISGRFAHTTIIVTYIPHQGHHIPNYQRDNYAELEKTINAVSELPCCDGRF
jgi:exonuclease III